MSDLPSALSSFSNTLETGTSSVDLVVWFAEPKSIRVDAPPADTSVAEVGVAGGEAGPVAGDAANPKILR